MAADNRSTSDDTRDGEHGPVATANSEVIRQTTTEIPTTDAARPSAPRDETKLARVLELLQRDCGATLEELIAATNWLPHTTRAALTGLRKRGYAVTLASPFLRRISRDESGEPAPSASDVEKSPARK